MGVVQGLEVTTGNCRREAERFAVLVELRLVTDTDGHGHRPTASTADA